MNIYVENSKCKVNFVKPFELPADTGLRQDDVLSLIFFNIALKSVVRKLQKDYIGLKIGEKNMTMGGSIHRWIIKDEIENQRRNTA